MGGDRVAQPPDHDPEPVVPGGPGLRRRGVDGAEDALDHQPFELLAIVDIAIERHCAHPEFLGDGTHREPGEPLAVEDGEGGRGELIGGEGAGTRHGG
ncbi:hypothetical protein SANTM175S_01889 [Streptomyces antimycoticus]